MGLEGGVLGQRLAPMLTVTQVLTCLCSAPPCRREGKSHLVSHLLAQRLAEGTVYLTEPSPPASEVVPTVAMYVHVHVEGSKLTGLINLPRVTLEGGRGWATMHLAPGRVGEV